MSIRQFGFTHLVFALICRAMSHSSPQFSPLCHVGGFAATNGYAFQAPGGWIGVDAPEDFAGWLEGHGIRLSALLLTHAHFDHVMAAAAVARQHQCQVYAWEVSSPRTRLESLLRDATGIDLSVEDYPVHHELKSSASGSLSVCGMAISYAHVPGHSTDSVIFHLPTEMAVFSGDTLMCRTMGRTDFPGGSTSLLMAGMRRELLGLPDPTKVYPGHGPETTVGAERGWVERGF